MGSEICNKIKPWGSHSISCTRPSMLPTGSVLHCLPSSHPLHLPCICALSFINHCSSSNRSLRYGCRPDGTNPSGVVPVKPCNLPGCISSLCVFNFPSHFCDSASHRLLFSLFLRLLWSSNLGPVLTDLLGSLL